MQCHCVDRNSNRGKICKILYNNSNSDEDSIGWSGAVNFEDISELMEAKQFVDRPRKKFESLDLSNQSFNPPKPSIEEPLTLELKPLSQHLKYAYFGDNSTLSVVISSKLTPEQDVKFLEVFQ